MYQICGDQSLISFIWREQFQVLLNNPEFDQHVTIDEHYMAQIQWGQNSVLGDPELTMMGVAPLDSISSIDAIFNANPEFGSYVINNGRPDLVLTAQQTAILLAQETGNY